MKMQLGKYVYDVSFRERQQEGIIVDIISSSGALEIPEEYDAYTSVADIAQASYKTYSTVRWSMSYKKLTRYVVVCDRFGPTAEAITTAMLIGGNNVTVIDHLSGIKLKIKAVDNKFDYDEFKYSFVVEEKLKRVSKSSWQEVYTTHEGYLKAKKKLSYLKKLRGKITERMYRNVHELLQPLTSYYTKQEREAELEPVVTDTIEDTILKVSPFIHIDLKRDYEDMVNIIRTWGRAFGMQCKLENTVSNFNSFVEFYIAKSSTGTRYRCYEYNIEKAGQKYHFKHDVDVPELIKIVTQIEYYRSIDAALFLETGYTLCPTCKQPHLDYYALPYYPTEAEIRGRIACPHCDQIIYERCTTCFDIVWYVPEEDLDGASNRCSCGDLDLGFPEDAIE